MEAGRCALRRRHFQYHGGLTVGLAPFFDRARQSAAQLLRNFDPDAFERRLGEVVVTLAFDAQAAASVEGLASLDMAARLIARLYPRVRVKTLGGDDVLADELIELMRTINPHMEIQTETGAGLHIAVVAGNTTIEADRTIYMGDRPGLDRRSGRLGRQPQSVRGRCGGVHRHG
jgi:hypothetical protein